MAVMHLRSLDECMLWSLDWAIALMIPPEGRKGIGTAQKLPTSIHVDSLDYVRSERGFLKYFGCR